MDKIELLKKIGFSQEFINKLEDYQNTITEISSYDPSCDINEYVIKDSNNILIKNINNNSNTEYTISIK